jgi:hypothetical protein
MYDLEVILKRGNFMMKRSACSEKNLIKMSIAPSTAEPVTTVPWIMGRTDFALTDWGDFDAARQENYTVIYLFCLYPPVCYSVYFMANTIFFFANKFSITVLMLILF